MKTRKLKLKYGRRFKTYKGGNSSDKDLEQPAMPFQPGSTPLYTPPSHPSPSHPSPSHPSPSHPPPSYPPPSYPPPSHPSPSHPPPSYPPPSYPPPSYPPPSYPPPSYPPPSHPPPSHPSSRRSPKKYLQEMKQKIPVSNLKDKTRMLDFPYEKRVHSDDPNVIEMKKEELEKFVKEKLKGLYSSSDTSSSDKKTYQRRVAQMKPPTPPKVELTPSGRNLATTYTPTYDIVEDSKRIPVYGNPHMTAKGYKMDLFVYPYSHPLPLSYNSNAKKKKLTKSEKDAYRSIRMFPITYEFLSPMLFDILLKINNKNAYADILVYGKLRDELIPCIAISSRKALESRLFLSDPEIDNFIAWINMIVKGEASIGPTPFNIYEPPIPNLNVITPETTPPDPTSLQVVGYDTHPMFKSLTDADKRELVEMSEKHKKIKGEDFLFLPAHGSIDNELSPEMKFLANKYLRIIEMSKAGSSIRPKYMNYVFEINNILRNPKDLVMFDNTTKGAQKRKEIFDKLCYYISSDEISLCKKSDTFDLIDITHERSISGHVDDSMIKQDHKITYKTIHLMKSMGFFVPINFESDKSTPYTYNKELFRLYPGTTFLAKNKDIKLIETLLPIAIRKNKRINIIIFSCNGYHSYDDEINNVALFPKPGLQNPAIKLLTTAKRYIANCSRVMGYFINSLEDNGINLIDMIHDVVDGEDKFTLNTNYITTNNIDTLVSFSDKLIDFCNTSFVLFIYSNFKIPKIEEIFSFAGLDENAISNNLILYNEPLKDKDYYSYRNELIKVKIYLMKEFMDILSMRILMIKTIIENLSWNMNVVRDMYCINPNPPHIATCKILNNAIVSAERIFNYFNGLIPLINYIREGFRNNPYDPDVFMNFTIFKNVMKEYNDSNTEELYDLMVENMDYDRYEGEDIGLSERVYKKTHLNPLDPGQFRRNARFLYKYKKLQNVDDVKERRKTMKQKLKNQMRIGDKAYNAKDIHAVSV